MHQKPKLSAPCAACLVMLQVHKLCLATQQGMHLSCVLPWWVHISTQVQACSQGMGVQQAKLAITAQIGWLACMHRSGIFTLGMEWELLEP